MIERQAVDEVKSGAEATTAFRDKWVPLAMAGLERMSTTEADLYCDKAVAGKEGQLTLLGRSNRYSAMVAIGAAAWRRAGNDVTLPFEAILDRLAPWAAGHAGLGEASLVLWALSLARDARATSVAESLVARHTTLAQGGAGLGTMPLGWIVKGLSEGLRMGVSGVERLASEACEQLLSRQDKHTGLFPLAGNLRRMNLFAYREATRLGSFASQVYPIMGLATYGAVVGCPRARAAAIACADRICDLQGPAGQWWWIYQVRSGSPAIKYPVYSVHQDAMGPMALLELRQLGALTERHLSAIGKSLSWMDHHPELPTYALIDESRRVVWRAIQRDKPSTTADYGLGRGPRYLMQWRAWSGGVDRQDFRGGYVCYECRPYHLGWILLAAALAAE